MSKLEEESITIFEALQFIKNGKYVMPAFQRQYVWNMEQIEKLWDSILLHYPIATFLFWHLDGNNVPEDTYFCNFLTDAVTFNSHKVSETRNYELSSIDVKTRDTAVLDGQQRLTSLFISLFGEVYIRPSNARKRNGEKIPAKLLIELDEKRILTDDNENEFNSKKHDIAFHTRTMSPTSFEIKNILGSKFQNKITRDSAIEEFIANVPLYGSKDYAKNILETLCKKIFDEKLVRYTKILDMKQDDALEMFVRFNSGGKVLRKHEITMSILEAYWHSAKNEFGKLLTGSYERFGTDFIIRSALMLFGDVVKTTINKGIADDLRNNWDNFKKTLINLEELLKELGIDVSRFANSWNVLLPIIFSIFYQSSSEKDNKAAIRAYLIRAVFFTYFQSGTTAKLQQMKSQLLDFNRRFTIEMLDKIGDLRVTEARIEDIVNTENGRLTGEVLYYLSTDWLNKHFKYEQDHLHPFSRFDRSNPPDVLPEDWNKWRNNRNRLPNLHLLEGRTNASKGDMSLIDYYSDMNDEQKTKFRENAIIPEDISLEIREFDNFYEARKKKLADRIRILLDGDEPRQK